MIKYEEKEDLKLIYICKNVQFLKQISILTKKDIPDAIILNGINILQLKFKRSVYDEKDLISFIKEINVLIKAKPELQTKMMESLKFF